MYAGSFLGPECEPVATEMTGPGALEPDLDRHITESLTASEDMTGTTDADATDMANSQVKNFALNVNVLSQNYYQCRAARVGRRSLF